MSATARWFGSSDRPLFGWFHVPEDGRARAGVVLCPSFGVEYLGADFTFRQLALDLESRRFAVVRLDYDGQGDSGGLSTDPGRVDAWQSSIATAVAELRELGATRTVLIGLRLGAVLAASAMHGTDALVLWDPARSGRTFLREQRALLMMSESLTESLVDGSIEGPGIVYRPETVTGLGALDLATTAIDAGRVLVLTRPDRPADRRLADALAPLPRVDWADANGSAELLDQFYDIDAVKTIRTIAEWVDGAVGPETTPVNAPAEARTVVGRDPAGRPIVEEVVRLGPLGLIGIATEPTVARRGPTALFLDVATDHHVGPSRLWVDLARSWAALGIRSVRFDFSGVCDSPVRPGQPANVSYAPEALEDIVDVAHAVTPHDPTDVLLIGLCSGAYNAIDAAIGLKPRAICAINPILTFVPDDVARGEPDPRRHIARTGWTRLLAFGNTRWGAGIKGRLPERAWQMLERLNIEASPTVAIKQLGDRGVETLLVCDVQTARPLQRAGADVVRRLTASGKLIFVMPPGLDHSLLGYAGKETTARTLTDYVIRRFVAEGAPPR